MDISPDGQNEYDAQLVHHGHHDSVSGNRLLLVEVLHQLPCDLNISITKLIDAAQCVVILGWTCGSSPTSPSENHMIL